MKCDQDRWLYMAGQSDFNSRTHVKCDALLQNVKKLSRYFNSRTHVECDRSHAHVQFSIWHFNSRTHVECDVEEMNSTKNK